MISVIVPSYNIEPYLERCVDSLVNQTYRDLEIILVDDGSTDGTGKLCDRLTQRDPRIKAVHKENGGLSDARNAGIDCANGEFYSFIDGDDFIEPDTYEAMIAEMEDPQVSIVAGGFIVTDFQGNTNISACPERRCLSKEEAFMDMFGKCEISVSSCNKLFRSRLFENIRYKKGIVNEDMEILPRLLDVSNCVVILDKAIYHYIKRQGNITSAGYSTERYKTIETVRNIYFMCKAKYPKLQPYASIYELQLLYRMLVNLTQDCNRKKYKMQEFSLRRKIIAVSFRSSRWKEIRDAYGSEMITYVVRALIGIRTLSVCVAIKQKLCKK